MNTPVSRQSNSRLPVRRPITQRPIIRRRPPIPRNRPIIKNNKPKQKNKKNYKDYTDILEDIFNSIVVALNRPIVLIVLLCVIAVVYTHHTHFDSGLIGKWVKANSTNSLAIWIRDNVLKFLGLLIFIPTILDSPSKTQPLLFATAIFWVMIIPEASIYEYVIQSFALHTYFRVKLQKTRLTLLIFVIIAYFAGFWTLPSHKS